MAESAIEQAFATLAEAFTITESEIHEEVSLVEQQIEELKDRIIELQEKQQTLAHDRVAIEEMYKRYCEDSNGNAVEF